MNRRALAITGMLTAALAAGLISTPPAVAKTRPITMPAAEKVMLNVAQARALGVPDDGVHYFTKSASRKGTIGDITVCYTPEGEQVFFAGPTLSFSSAHLPQLGGSQFVFHYMMVFPSAKVAKARWDSIVSQAPGCAGTSTQPMSDGIGITTVTQGLDRNGQSLWIRSEGRAEPETPEGFRSSSYKVFRLIGNVIQILEVDHSGIAVTPLTGQEITLIRSLSVSLGNAWRRTFG